MVKHLALHETLDLHELLAFKNLCLTKTTTMSKLAEDEELRTIMEADAAAGIQHIQQIQKFLTNRGDMV
ncbi:hypothetical protein [Neobacillus mesonae]|uniref:hypothetical protein n=1 Tax=Neobacillus mesonae TaxID=1193713 RepID=UPI0025744C35|nr:hypothetical protein [Neobacillus mesonae]MED4207319.1 hypothetical protein [Neobacillus mesonae]